MIAVFLEQLFHTEHTQALSNSRLRLMKERILAALGSAI